MREFQTLAALDEIKSVLLRMFERDLQLGGGDLSGELGVDAVDVRGIVALVGEPGIRSW